MNTSLSYPVPTLPVRSKCRRPVEILFRTIFLGGVFLGSLAPQVGYGATVTQIASNSFGTSSFNSAVNWSDATAPNAGNDYINAQFNLRTPIGVDGPSTSFVFAGNSLTLGDGTNTGVMGFKGKDGAIITVNNLILNKGNVRDDSDGNINGVGTTNNFTLAGNVFVKNGGANFITNSSIEATNTTPTTNIKNITVSANIADFAGQSGKVTVSHASPAANVTSIMGSITLTGTNTYTGGTDVMNLTTLIVNAGSTLGANVTGNNVSILGGGQLTLNINTSIGDQQKLSLAAGLAVGSINLNWDASILGSDTVAGLSFDGGTTFLGAGTYDITTLNNLYGSNVFTGSGSITVVPEPTVVVLMALGAMMFLWRRRQCAA